MSIPTRSDLVINKIRNILNDDSLSFPNLECNNFTSYKPICLSQKWIIKNIRSILISKAQQICLKSGIFSSVVVLDINWRMYMFPRGGILVGIENVFIFVEVNSTSQYKKLTFNAKHNYIIKNFQNQAFDWKSDIIQKYIFFTSRQFDYPM
uniref:Uncharacterized protein n=1 Tax=Strongyloides venezuelensis TaxID=75913 RepID=A0A0K0EZI3_STRVS